MIVEKDQCKRSHQATGDTSRLSLQKSTSICEKQDKVEGLVDLQRGGVHLQQQVHSAEAEMPETCNSAECGSKGLY